jgi:AcrR family transcriptional regulator
MEAARKVMGRDGVETSSIPTIVDEAGVGRGSFYNHFGSKEELARAVFHQQTLVLREELDDVTRGADDIPRAISYGIRRCLEKAAEDPLWGWFMIHATPVLGDFMLQMHDSAQLGLSRGQAMGLLLIEDIDATTILLGGGVTALLSARLKGAISEERSYAAVEGLLRLTGVDPVLAREITQESMDDLRRKLRAPQKGA